MGYTETYRGIVAPADCDRPGHMTVSRHLSFAVVRAESDFRAEVLVDQTTAVREIGTKSATFRNRLHAGGARRLAYKSLFKTGPMNLSTRRGAEIPPDMRAALEALLAA